GADGIAGKGRMGPCPALRFLARFRDENVVLIGFDNSVLQFLAAHRRVAGFNRVDRADVHRFTNQVWPLIGTAGAGCKSGKKGNGKEFLHGGPPKSCSSCRSVVRLIVCSGVRSPSKSSATHDQIRCQYFVSTPPRKKSRKCPVGRRQATHDKCRRVLLWNWPEAPQGHKTAAPPPRSAGDGPLVERHRLRALEKPLLHGFVKHFLPIRHLSDILAPAGAVRFFAIDRNGPYVPSVFACHTPAGGSNLGPGRHESFDTNLRALCGHSRS